jgi:hypothetical protein
MATAPDGAIWRHLAIVPDTPTYEHVKRIDVLIKKMSARASFRFLSFYFR